jgi:endoglucanase
MDVKNDLKELTAMPGASGDERAIAALIQEKWKPLTDEITIDHMGNVVALKKGTGAEPRRRVLIAAHMDEIGLLVTEFGSYNGNGFLRTTNLGGVDTRHLYGQRVLVHGQKDLPGIMGALPKRMQPEDKKKIAPDLKTLWIDTGLPETELKKLVSVGDFVTFYQPMRDLLGSWVTGKSFDNRASVVAVTVALDYLQKRAHEWDLLAVATVQEEMGLLGASTSGTVEKPDIALAVDVTFGKGPGATDGQAYKLGGGPVLGLGPHLHEGVMAGLKAAAGTLEMKVEREPHVLHSGTDASALQIVNAGIPTGLVGIPLRYMHTMVETIDTKDINRAGRLMGEFVAQLDGEFMENLQKELMESGD